jgi:hypothetical protein
MDAVMPQALCDEAPSTDAGHNGRMRTVPQSHHHLFALWADVVRRRLVRHVRYGDAVWRPTVMCIEITQQCNAECNHCASNSTPATKIRLSPEKVVEIVEQAARQGVRFLGITGGEPFLERKTMLAAIAAATANDIRFDYINSNCFWAKTESAAVDILRQIKEVAHPDHVKQKRGMFSISVTSEHLRFVDMGCIINAIRALQHVFPSQTIELVGVRGEMFGVEQAPLFEQVIERLGNDVLRVERDDHGRVSRIHTRGGEIDVFFNYIVPIGRGEDMDYEHYEHYELTEKELKRGLSMLEIDGTVAQTITVGWDGKSAPDVVLKCSESIIAGNLYLESFADLIANGNNDPLIRGVLSSVYRIISISKRTGIFEQMRERLRFHNSIQGYVSEFMKDPKKRLLMSLDLLAEDIAGIADVRWPDDRPMTDIDDVIRVAAGARGHVYLRALRHLIATHTYHFNFSRTAIATDACIDPRPGHIE